MINHILALKESAERLGIKFANRERHTWFRSNSKTTYAFKIVLQDGAAVLEEVDLEVVQSLHYFYRDNHNQMFTWVYSPKKGESLSDLKEKVREKVKRTIANTIDLLEDIQTESQNVPSLSNCELLASVLRNSDTNEIASQVLAKIKALDGKILFAFDLPNTIQTNDFMWAINDVLVKIAKGANETDKDDFDNPYSSENTMSGPIKIDGIGNMIFFSRNPASKCYARFGLIGEESCLIGSTTRRTVATTLQYLLSPEMKSKYKQGGVWYRIELAGHSYFILTTISHKSSLLELGADPAEFGLGNPTDTWAVALQQIAEATRQQSMLMPDANGELLVLQKLKGAWHVAGHMCMSLDTISAQILEWRNGCLNGPTMPKFGQGDRVRFGYPSILSLLNTLNRDWHSGDLYNKFSVLDAYNLFYNDANAAQRALHLFANCCFPYAIRLVNDRESRPAYERQFFHGIVNLILHKLGYIYDHKNIKFTGGNPMDNWAFAFGRLLNTSNWLYEHWFKWRGQPVPRQLIGPRYCTAMQHNVPQTVERFLDEFIHCYGYFESERARGQSDHLGDVEKMLRTYDKRWGEFKALQPPVLPDLLSSAQKLQFYSGYFSRIPAPAAPDNLS